MFFIFCTKERIMEEQLIYIIMIISIALSALCSMLEATLLSTPLSYIAGLEEQGVKGSIRLKRLKMNTDRPISAILCLNTIANTVGASIVGSLVYEVYGDALVGIFSTIFTLCILILSEIIPKTIGTSYWRTLAIPASVIIDAMIFISFPLVWVLEHLQHLIPSKSNQVSVSREDISAMVSVATEEEVIEKDEKKMIQNLLKLDEVTAHEIMTPSVLVEMVPGTMTIKEFYDEGEAMHHCVFTNKYYSKDGCLIIGARVNGERAETIEVNTKEWRIMQCRGKHNQDSQYHEAIMEAMTNNINKYRRMAL